MKTSENNMALNLYVPENHYFTNVAFGKFLILASVTIMTSHLPILCSIYSMGIMNEVLI